MKKHVCMLLIALVLLLSSMGTPAFASANEEYTYLTFLNFYSPGWIRDFTNEPVDESRAAHAFLCFAEVPAVLILPERSEWAEAHSSVGARVTFDRPFDVLLDDNGFEIVQIPYGVILEPKRLEAVGDVVYGMIVEIGDDYVILDSYDEYGGLTGNNTRYTITPDTLQNWTNFPFQPGSGCQMIMDSEGVILAMDEAYS